MDNVLNAIGDVLMIKTTAKIKGKVHITNFAETITGETETRSLMRQFRVSQDSIFWSDWQLMTAENLSKQTYICSDFLNIEIRYTRTGTDASGTITFSDVTFSGSCEEVKYIAPTLTNSIFSRLMGSEILSKIESNLLKKLYYRGVVPDYITRGENRSYEEDKDYVGLFFPIARFFGLILAHLRRFENIDTDEDLLREQLRSYGIYFDESATTLEELQYLAANILSQYQQRGTKMIFQRKNDIAIADGEFVRLTRNKEYNELLNERIPPSKMGWCLGKSSPIYRGTARAWDLNKTADNTEDFESSAYNYIICSKGNASFSFGDTYQGKKIVSLLATANGDKVGFGRILTDYESEYYANSIKIVRTHMTQGNKDFDYESWLSLPERQALKFTAATNSESVEFIAMLDFFNPDKYFVVDPNLDYEITFSFYIPNSTNAATSSLLFAVEGFDRNLDLLNDAFSDDSGTDDTFFEKTLTTWKKGMWYQARGIIHAYSTVPHQEKTNLGVGNNLYFQNSFTRYILPKIQLQNSAAQSNQLYIWDYKIRPLARGRNVMPLKSGETNAFSLGFIEAGAYTHTYYRNNNNSQSQDEVTNIIDRELMPFDATNLFTILKNK